MTAWIKTPEQIVTLDYGTGKSVVTGRVRIAFIGNGNISVQTQAHVNDDAPAVTYRGKDYLVNLSFVRQADGTLTEHPHNTRQNVSPRRTSDPFAAAPKTIRAAIVAALRAAIDAATSGGYSDIAERAANHAHAAQRLHSLEPQRAKLAAQLAELDAEIAQHRANLAASTTTDREVTMYQVPSTEILKALQPGSRVTDTQGRTHTLNNVTFDTEVESGTVTNAAGYSREADGWLNLLTGKVKSGPWLEA